jgi:hypothetical protein
VNFTVDFTLILAVVSLATSMLAFAKVFFDITKTIVALQVKVDTMWNFTLRRGISEVVINDLGKVNSPIVFTEKAVEVIAPLAQKLRDFYDKLKPIDDNELFIRIEQEFGQLLLYEICIPHALHLGACLVIAVEAAKGNLACPPPEEEGIVSMSVEG